MWTRVLELKMLGEEAVWGDMASLHPLPCWCLSWAVLFFAGNFSTGSISRVVGRFEFHGWRTADHDLPTVSHVCSLPALCQYPGSRILRGLGGYSGSMSHQEEAVSVHNRESKVLIIFVSCVGYMTFVADLGARIRAGYIRNISSLLEQSESKRN